MAQPCFCKVSYFSQYIKDKVLTKTLFRPLKALFPIEFIKAFSQLSLCYQESLCFMLFFFVFVNIFPFAIFLWQIPSSSFLKKFHCLCCLLFLVFLCFLEVYVETAQQCSLATQQVFVCLSFFKIVKIQKNTFKSIKQNAFINLFFTIYIDWQSA